MKLMAPALVSEVAPVTPAEAPPMLLSETVAPFVTVRLVSADPPPTTPEKVTVPAPAVVTVKFRVLDDESESIVELKVTL